MGSEVLVTGSITGVTGNVPGPPEGFRGSTGRGHQPGRLAWAKSGKGPTPEWAGAPPTKAQGAARRREGKP